ncbi:MAG: urease accessory protein UreF [Tidjanibacter sp.]|nr:urease accessory protein UreF [Tidjanibacter sp.]
MERILNLVRLLQFSDSAFPTGAFSFSNGLESATEHGMVCDSETLREYVRTMATQTAHTDAVIAINTYRNHKQSDYEGICRADKMVVCYKLNEESRAMSIRMGRKMAELACRLCSDMMLKRWLADITGGQTCGTLPVAQGLTFAACDLSESALFCSQLYGTANIILGAALRCMRISHYDTQQILFSLNTHFETLYQEAREMKLENINAFSPEADIFTALHEKGKKRLFMN